MGVLGSADSVESPPRILGCTTRQVDGVCQRPEKLLPAALKRGDGVRPTSSLMSMECSFCRLGSRTLQQVDPGHAIRGRVLELFTITAQGSRN